MTPSFWHCIGNCKLNQVLQGVSVFSYRRYDSLLARTDSDLLSWNYVPATNVFQHLIWFGVSMCQPRTNVIFLIYVTFCGHEYWLGWTTQDNSIFPLHPPTESTSLNEPWKLILYYDEVTNRLARFQNSEYGTVFTSFHSISNKCFVRYMQLCIFSFSKQGVDFCEFWIAIGGMSPFWICHCQGCNALYMGIAFHVILSL